MPITISYGNPALVGAASFAAAREKGKLKSGAQAAKFVQGSIDRRNKRYDDERDRQMRLGVAGAGFDQRERAMQQRQLNTDAALNQRQMEGEARKNQIMQDRKDDFNKDQAAATQQDVDDRFEDAMAEHVRRLDEWQKIKDRADKQGRGSAEFPVDPIQVPPRPVAPVRPPAVDFRPPLVDPPRDSGPPLESQTYTYGNRTYNWDQLTDRAKDNIRSGEFGNGPRPQIGNNPNYVPPSLDGADPSGASNDTPPPESMTYKWNEHEYTWNQLDERDRERVRSGEWEAYDRGSIVPNPDWRQQYEEQIDSGDYAMSGEGQRRADRNNEIRTQIGNATHLDPEMQADAYNQLDLDDMANSPNRVALGRKPVPLETFFDRNVNNFGTYKDLPFTKAADGTAQLPQGWQPQESAEDKQLAQQNKEQEQEATKERELGQTALSLMSSGGEGEGGATTPQEARRAAVILNGGEAEYEKFGEGGRGRKYPSMDLGDANVLAEQLNQMGMTATVSKSTDGKQGVVQATPKDRKAKRKEFLFDQYDSTRKSLIAENDLRTDETGYIKNYEPTAEEINEINGRKYDSIEGVEEPEQRSVFEPEGPQQSVLDGPVIDMNASPTPAAAPQATAPPAAVAQPAPETAVNALPDPASVSINPQEMEGARLASEEAARVEAANSNMTESQRASFQAANDLLSQFGEKSMPPAQMVEYLRLMRESRGE